MKNLDLIIGTSLVVILFIIFVVSTLREFKIMSENEAKRGEQRDVK
jgi:hypothetical protein